MSSRGGATQESEATGHSTAETEARHLLESVPAVAYILELDSLTMRYVSPQVTTLLDYPREQFLGSSESWLSVVHADDRERIRALTRSRLEFECEYRVITGRGEERWVLDRHTIARDVDGRPLFLKGVATDVTRLKKAEHLARQRKAQLRSVFAALGEGIVVLDRNGEVATCNEAAARLMGVSVADLVGARPPLVAPRNIDFEDGTRLDPENCPAREVYATGRPVRDVVLRLSGGGSPEYWVVASLQPLTHDGGLAGVVCSMVDVTAQRAAKEAVGASERRKATVIDGALDCVVMADQSDTIVEFNQAAERVFGYRREDAVGRTVEELLVPPRLRGSYRHELAQYRRTGSSPLCGRRVLGRAMRSNGEEFAIELSLTITETGEWTGFVRDITTRQLTERALVAERDRARSYLDIARTMMLALDRDGRVTMVNRQVCTALGRTEADLIGNDWFETVAHRPGREVFERAMAGEIELPSYVESDIEAAGGERRLIAWQCAAILDEQGRPAGTLSSGEDVTDHRRAQERLEFLAYHDTLTSLPNRAMFEQQLVRAIDARARTGGAAAVLFLGLDRFGLVNDSLGHAVGDRVLEMVASRLREAVGDGGLLARQGGDEFLVLLDCLPADAHPHVDRVVDAIQHAFAEPFDVAGAEFEIGVSAGIAVCPEHASDAQALLRSADTAMRRAKHDCCGRAVAYVSAASDPHERLAMTARLRRALTRDEFVVHYQPIVAAHSGRTVAVEALLRWQDPDNGLIGAGAFISLAEDTGLIRALGEWVLRAVAEQAGRWHAEGNGVPVSFNVAPAQLRDPRFPELIAEQLERNGLPGEALIVELTESPATYESRDMHSALERIAALGVRLAIDDFGADYSSLARLRDMPVHILKLDRSFLTGVPDDPRATAMLISIVALARALDLVAVVEGVEHAEQQGLLADHHGLLAQGFHFARPVPADQLTHPTKESNR